MRRWGFEFLLELVFESFHGVHIEAVSNKPLSIRDISNPYYYFIIDDGSAVARFYHLPHLYTDPISAKTTPWHIKLSLCRSICKLGFSRNVTTKRVKRADTNSSDRKALLYI